METKLPYISNLSSSSIPRFYTIIEMAFALPQLFAQIPRYPILYPHPSPIHPLPSLSSRRIRVFAKREDHSSPLACAGNKYRKLEYIIPDILSPSPNHHKHEHDKPEQETETVTGPATTLVTEGAIQSNHTVQVSSLARTLGLNSVVLLHSGTGGGLNTSTDKTAFLRCGNVQMNHLLGAEVRILDESDPLAHDARPVLSELRARGHVPYWIPGGASLHPLGGLGYARAAMEIESQEERMKLPGSGRFDYVFVACGSGSTLGGLIAGFTLLEKLRGGGNSSSSAGSGNCVLPRRNVIGILISPTKPREYHEQRVLAFARRAGALIGLDPGDIVPDVRLDDRFVGTAYGVLDVETRMALEMMAQTESMMLDPVYTAKVARGMMHWVQEGEIREDAQRQGNEYEEINVLFIHTGGQAALGAYADVT